MVTGVDVRQRGGFGVQTDISIDGGTFDQIAILLNGVNIGNPQTGHLSADFPVSLEDIERIEIIEGAAARVFGASAFNGAVNIVTKKGQRSKAKGLKTKVEGVVALEGGSYGTFGGNGRIAGKKMSLSAGYRQSDGGTENSYFRQSQGFYSLTSHLSPLTFHLTLGATGKRYGANTFYSAAYPDQYESNGRFFASADVIGKLSDSFQFQVQPYWNLNTDHFQLIRGSGVGENFHRTNVVGGKINGYFDWLLGKTSCGVEIRSESIRRTFHSDRTEYSLFLEHNIIYKRCTVSMGVVADRNTGYDGRFHFFPGIDAKYRVWKTAKGDCDIFISYNTAFRMPTFTDLFYKSPTNEGNKDLKPERVQSLRVGGKYTSKLLTLNSQLFYDWGTDMIDWVMYSPQDIWHSANFRLDNRGFSINSKLSTLNSQLSFLAGYCFIDQKRYDDVSIYRSNYAMEYLKHKVTLSPRLSILHSSLFTLHFLVSYRWQDRQGPLYKPFSLIDAKITLEHKKYEATLSLNNITSYRYYDLSTVPQPGFWCMAGIKVKCL
jgi:iron complex outermembrane receptor protein